MCSSASQMRKCAVELTGRNSVSPSTTPRKIDSKYSYIAVELLKGYIVTWLQWGRQLYLFAFHDGSVASFNYLLTVPPFPVHRFGYAPLLPPRLQRFCHHRFFPSSPRPEWLPPHAARDRPQSRSRISFSEGK